MVRQSNCKRISRREQLAKMYGLLVEDDPRAHDRDQRVPILVGRQSRGRPRCATGFQARRLLCFRRS
jgi:hypothetical protein